jgi:CheY-like chemotaxis protein
MLKILVVDDEEAVLKIISKVLKTVGHSVEEAVNGAEAIRKFNECEIFKEHYLSSCGIVIKAFIIVHSTVFQIHIL